MTRSITIFISALLVAFSTISLAQVSDFNREGLPRPNELFQTPGMVFYSPSQYFGGELDAVVKLDIPEVEVLNSTDNKEVAQLNKFLMGEGVSMGFGFNPNRDSYFDLYGNVSVDVELKFPAPQYGYTPQSEGGRAYFPIHDGMHIYALPGVGPRRADLANKKETIERWVKVLMDAEALATAFNSAYQVKEYWDWKVQQPNSGKTPDQIRQFMESNRGVMSMGTWNYQGFMDVVLANVRGQMYEQYSQLRKYINWEQFKAARDAGIPQIIPPLDNKLTAKGEELFIKYAFAPVVAATSYFRYKSGYLDLIRSTRELLGYYYSDFYVEWADRFQIGEDINTAEKNLAEKIELFRQGKVLSDVVDPAPGRHEVQQIRNLSNQMGRKLIELKHLRTLSPESVTEADVARLEAMIADLVDFNERLLADKAANRSYSAAEIAQVRSQYLAQVTRAEKQFPVSRMIPNRFRLGYASYENFWNDPFALVLDRKIVLDKFLSVKSVWREALKQRMDRAQAERKGKTYTAIDETIKPRLVDVLNQQAAARYNRQRKGEVVAEGQLFEENFYMNRVEIFRRSFLQQISNYIEQVKEYPQLESAERVQLIAEAEKFRDAIDAKLLQHKQNYQSRYIEMNRQVEIKHEMWQAEGDLKWAIEKSFVSMIEILDALDEGKKYKSLKSSRKVILENTKSIIEGTRIIPSLYDMIRKVTPMKRGLFHTTCSAIARICANQDLTKIVKALPTKSYARDSQYSEVVRVVDPATGKAASQMPELPKDAIIMLSMNHDHAALDAKYIMQIAEMLGIDKNLLLTTELAWPQFEPRKFMGRTFSLHRNKDPYLALKEEQDPTFKERALQFFRTHQNQRVGFSIFPEGELPFWGVQFPLFANWGAFSLARKAAIEWAGKRPVYYVEIHANFLRYVTAKTDMPIQLDIIKPELVPTDALTERDPWIESRRQLFEERANDPNRRGEMYDMIERRKIEGGRINTVEPVRRYVPLRENGIMSNIIDPRDAKPPALSSGAAVRCGGAYGR